MVNLNLKDEEKMFEWVNRKQKVQGRRPTWNSGFDLHKMLLGFWKEKAEMHTQKKPAIDKEPCKLFLAQTFPPLEEVSIGLKSLFVYDSTAS